MTNKPVDFPMSLRERIGGIIYIPLHCLIIPILVVLIDEFSDKITFSDATTNLLVYGIGFVFCLLFMWKFLKKSFDDIFEKKVRVLGRVLGGFGLMYLLSVATTTVITVVVGDADLINPNSAELNSLISQNFNAMAVMSVIFAPIVEECIFRGALFGSIRKKSRFLAYFVTIAVFAFYHLFAYFIIDYKWQLWVYLLQYVPASFALCRVYEKSETIWCPIALHAINNLIALNVSKLV